MFEVHHDQLADYLVHLRERLTCNFFDESDPEGSQQKIDHSVERSAKNIMRVMSEGIDISTFPPVTVFYIPAEIVRISVPNQPDEFAFVVHQWFKGSFIPVFYPCDSFLD